MIKFIQKTSEAQASLLLYIRELFNKYMPDTFYAALAIA
jgi:hypothetical protein